MEIFKLLDKENVDIYVNGDNPPFLTFRKFGHTAIIYNIQIEGNILSCNIKLEGIFSWAPLKFITKLTKLFGISQAISYDPDSSKLQVYLSHIIRERLSRA